MNTFEWDEETPVTANNMNEMQNIINNNFKDTITNITTDANGWTVIEHDNYIEYLKKGTYNRSMGANTWTRANISSLPIGFTSLGDAFLTGSSVGNDGVLGSSLGTEPSSSFVYLQVYNPYVSTINAKFYWNARILKLKEV